jgi:hypothetical protein
LFLGTPRNKIRAKKNTVTHGEATSVRATCPIDINQASQVRMHISVEVNASTKGTFKLTQNKLNDLEGEHYVDFA